MGVADGDLELSVRSSSRAPVSQLAAQASAEVAIALLSSTLGALALADWSVRTLCALFLLLSGVLRLAVMLGIHARRRYVNRGPRRPSPRAVVAEHCAGACVDVKVAKECTASQEWPAADNVVPTICRAAGVTQVLPNSDVEDATRDSNEAHARKVLAVDCMTEDLSQRLDDAYAKLEAAGAREQHLAEVARARTARSLRLAVRLEVQRERAKQEKAALRRRLHCQEQIVNVQPPPQPPHSQAVTFSEVEDLKSEILALKECLDAVKLEAEKFGAAPEDLAKAIETTVSAAVEDTMPELPLWLQGRAPVIPTAAWEKTEMVDSCTQACILTDCTDVACQTAACSLSRRDAACGSSAVLQEDVACGPDVAFEASSLELPEVTAPGNAAAKTTSTDVQAPKASEKLAELAASSPEVRQTLLAKLRAAKAGEPTVGAKTTVHNQSQSEVDSPPIGFAVKPPQGPAHNEIVGRISQLSAANEELRAKIMSSEAETRMVRQELAARREAAEIHERELSRARADSRTWEKKAAEAAKELQEEFRRNAAKSSCAGSSHCIDGSGIKLNWASAWEWPGGTASARGMDQLRRSIDGREARLDVGPPPADWRVWMQLGLRRRQPAEPALLRLAVDGAEGEAYTGLIWPAWMT